MTSAALSPLNASKQSEGVSARILNELIETSKKIPTSSSELGSIQLSVNEIRRRAHELRKKTLSSTTTLKLIIYSQGVGWLLKMSIHH